MVFELGTQSNPAFSPAAGYQCFLFCILDNFRNYRMVKKRWTASISRSLFMGRLLSPHNTGEEIIILIWGKGSFRLLLVWIRFRSPSPELKNLRRSVQSISWFWSWCDRVFGSKTTLSGSDSRVWDYCRPGICDGYFHKVWGKRPMKTSRITGFPISENNALHSILINSFLPTHLHIVPAQLSKPFCLMVVWTIFYWRTLLPMEILWFV